MSRVAWIAITALLAVATGFGGILTGALIQRYSLDRILRQFGLATYDFVPVPGGDTVLRTRRFVPAVSREGYDTEKDSVYEYKSHPIDIEKTALILVDTWDYHPNDGYLVRVKEHMDLKLKPLLFLARKYGLRVIHSPHPIPLSKGREISPGCAPADGELVIEAGLLSNATVELDDYLKAQGVTTLIYAGYAVNACIIIRPTGILKMKDLGYDPILIRDCTLAWETPESLEGEWAKKIGINFVEWFWGESTTLADLEDALAKISK